MALRTPGSAGLTHGHGSRWRQGLPRAWPPWQWSARRRALLAVAAVLAACALTVAGCTFSPAPGAPSGPTGGPPTSLAPPTVSTATTSSTTSTVRPTTTSTVGTTTTSQVVTGDPDAIAKQLKPSVVGITAVIATTKTSRTESVGTGVVFGTDGSIAFIVTNDHVIAREDGSASKQISVRLPSGSVVSAVVVGRDPDSDLAVLRVKSRRVEAAVFRTDLSGLAVGDWVVAIGNAKVLEEPVTSGRVTALYSNVDYPGLPSVRAVIESSVSLDPGNSGGPLLDAQGRVVGINTGELRDEPGAVSLPADFVVEVVTRLLAGAG